MGSPGRSGRWYPRTQMVLEEYVEHNEQIPLPISWSWSLETP